jgi:hypothetical protein
MDWIERIFGIDPDLGSGSLELLIAGTIVLVVATALVSRRSTRTREKAS